MGRRFRPMIAAFTLLSSYASPAPPLRIFANPQKACGLLAAEGFATPAWVPTSFGYECSSTNLRIDYVVSGDDGIKAKRIKLILDLRYQPGKDLEVRRVEFDRLATAMLIQLGLAPSKALHDAIRTTHQFRQEQPGAHITFDPGRRPFNRQVLIIRDSTIRVVAIPRSP
jgi:hypothetical protein